jgi:hypothetical protein
MRVDGTVFTTDFVGTDRAGYQILFWIRYYCVCFFFGFVQLNERDGEERFAIGKEATPFADQSDQALSSVEHFANVLLGLSAFCLLHFVSCFISVLSFFVYIFKSEPKMGKSHPANLDIYSARAKLSN